MSASTLRGHYEMTNWEFHQICAEELIHFVDDHQEKHQKQLYISMLENGHIICPIPESEGTPRCCVCQLESRMVKKNVWIGKWTKHLAKCGCESCGLFCHTLTPK